MPSDPPNYSRAEVAAFAVGVGVVGIGALLFTGRFAYCIYDDAYIYFRYARHVVEGCGLAFNCPGPPVEGFTSPAYLGLLSAAGLLTDDFETISQALGYVFTLIGLSLTLLLPLHPRWNLSSTGRLAVPVACAVVFALDDYLLVHAVTGMEVPLTWAVAAGFGIAAIADDHRALKALAVLGPLVRPEFALFSVGLLVFPVARRARYWLPIVAAGAGVVLVRWWIFGTLLPNTFWVKTGGTPHHLSMGLGYLAEALVDFPWVLLAPLAFAARRPRRGMAYLAVASTAWVAHVVWVGGDFYAGSRYLAPLVPLMTVLGLTGLYRVAERVAPAVGVGRQRAGVVLLAAVVIPVGLHLGLTVTRNINSRSFTNSVRLWRLTGEHIREHFPEASVATAAIGAIGYYSRAEIVDLVGLTDPRIGRYGRRAPKRAFSIGHNTYDTEVVLREQPDVVALRTATRGPWSPERPVQTGIFAEHDLVRTLKARDAPYVAYSPKLAGQVHGLLLVRRSLADQIEAAQRYPVDRVDVELTEPADPSPKIRWLLRLLGLPH
ncbi:MAG: hypothetical protein ABEL76_04405 [Bradymonadaceae bacterium]